MGVEIRRAELADIPEMLVIECQSFSHPWSANIFVNELTNPLCRYLCCFSDTEMAGYIGIKIILDEASIDNIAVKLSMRGKKISKLLLEHAEAHCRQHGAKSIFLEVRESNYIAIALYNGAGFEALGVIKGYYPDGENAILMKKKLLNT